MEIIVHYPEDEYALCSLCEQLAVQHGNLVYSCLNRLDLTREQKSMIIEGIEKKTGACSADKR